MNFLAVTTFSEAGLNLYGRRMVKSFVKNCSTIPLLVFSDGWSEAVGAAVQDLNSSSTWLTEFKKRHGAKQVVGDYRFDAVRFSHKVAALIAADQMTDADVLVWVDGDVVAHSPVMDGDLESLAPTGDEWISWLDRQGVYPECGFYMLNRGHTRHEEMMALFESMYARDKLFSLPEFHDSFVLEHVVKQAAVGTKSLSGAGKNTMHPMINGPLSKWFDHAKGERKKYGRTPAKERKLKDEVDYWR